MILFDDLFTSSWNLNFIRTTTTINNLSVHGKYRLLMLYLQVYFMFELKNYMCMPTWSLIMRIVKVNYFSPLLMGLLPDAQNCVLRMRRECRELFPATGGKRPRHASRHVPDARAVMHAGIVN